MILNKKNPNTWNSFSIPFEVGKFVLFPSYFQHSVPENKTKIVRKSVSMNIVPKGGLGDKKSVALGKMRPGKSNPKNETQIKGKTFTYEK